jgi:hypothetical protein
MTLISYPVTFTVRNENSVNVIGATIELTGYGTQITNSTGVATFAKDDISGGVIEAKMNKIILLAESVK